MHLAGLGGRAAAAQAGCSLGRLLPGLAAPRAGCSPGWPLPGLAAPWAGRSPGLAATGLAANAGPPGHRPAEPDARLSVPDAGQDQGGVVFAALVQGLGNA